jgi:drug/metabolite transporter (DMT)-like permease
VVWRRVLALGALTAVSAIGYLVGLKYAGVTLGTVLSSTSPLFALPIGRLVSAEPVTWRAAAGAVLCVAGIAVLSV